MPLLPLEQLQRLEALQRAAKRDPRWVLALGPRNAGARGVGSWVANHGARMPGAYNPLEAQGVGLIDPQAGAILPQATAMVANPPRVVRGGMGALIKTPAQPSMLSYDSGQASQTVPYSTTTGAYAAPPGYLAPTPGTGPIGSTVASLLNQSGVAAPRPVTGAQSPVGQQSSTQAVVVGDSTKEAYTKAVERLPSLDPATRWREAQGIRQWLMSLPQASRWSDSSWWAGYDSWATLWAKVSAERPPESGGASGGISTIGQTAARQLEAGGVSAGPGVLDAVGSFLTTIAGPAASMVAYARNKPDPQPLALPPPPAAGIPWAPIALGVGAAALIGAAALGRK